MGAGAEEAAPGGRSKQAPKIGKGAARGVAGALQPAPPLGAVLHVGWSLTRRQLSAVTEHSAAVLWATHLGRGGDERGSKLAQPAAGGGRGRGRKKGSKAAAGPVANEPDVLVLAEQLPRPDVVRLPLWRFGQPPTGARRAAAAFTRDFTATGAQPSLVVPASSTSMALHLQAAVGAPALPPPGPAGGKGPTTVAAPQERAMPGWVRSWRPGSGEDPLPEPLPAQNFLVPTPAAAEDSPGAVVGLERLTLLVGHDAPVVGAVALPHGGPVVTVDVAGTACLWDEGPGAGAGDAAWGQPRVRLRLPALGTLCPTAEAPTLLWPAETLLEGKKRGRKGKRGSGAEAEAHHGDRVSGMASAAGEEDDPMNDRLVASMALWMEFPDGAAGAEASARGGRRRARRGKGAAAAATAGGPGFSRVRLHRPKFARLGKAIVVRSQHGPDGALVARHSQRHILRECPYHVCHVLPGPRGAGLLVIVRFATDIDTARRGSGSGEEAGTRDDAGAFGRPGGPRTHFSVFHLVLTRAGDLEVAQGPPRVDINDAWGGERAPQCALWPGTAATGADYLLFHVAPGAVGLFSLASGLHVRTFALPGPLAGSTLSAMEACRLPGDGAVALLCAAEGVAGVHPVKLNDAACLEFWVDHRAAYGERDRAAAAAPSDAELEREVPAGAQEGGSDAANEQGGEAGLLEGPVE